VKFTAAAGALASALSLAGAAARGNRKNAADAARLVSADGAVSIRCSGVAIAISTSIAADVIQPGEIAVAAEKLANGGGEARPW
jgi:hypothetical protein